MTKTFRNLNTEAIKMGMKVGDAATEAFRMWRASKRQPRVRDMERMLRAASNMDKLRAQNREEWPAAAEIRKWREKRK